MGVGSKTQGGPVGAASLEVDGKTPVFFFGKLPKLDHAISGREPTSLFERLKRIAQVEGAAPDDSLSTNEVRVWMMTWGADLHEWMQRNREALTRVAKSEAAYPEEAIFKLLDDALAAREPPSKKASKK
jgi:hypothetical protein